jgi:hypothetical protein
MSFWRDTIQAVYFVSTENSPDTKTSLEVWPPPFRFPSLEESSRKELGFGFRCSIRETLIRLFLFSFLGI